MNEILHFEVSNPFFEGRNRVYVIASDPVTLIDTGVATGRAYESLQKGLQQHGLTVADIGRVILTHKHIDHIGNAWRIQRESGAEILIHESEMHAVNDVDPGGQRFKQLIRDRLRQWSVPADSFPTSDNQGPQWEIESAEAKPLADGQRIELADGDLEVIHTPGHTYGSICLRYGRQLLSGDHILPDISPNVGGGDMRRRGLLSEFLNSLRRVREISDHFDRVFPGHGEPFDHLAERCDELIRHHDQRLDKVVGILRNEGPQEVYSTARHLFGDLADFHVVLGCAEAQSHLDYLVDQGRATRQGAVYSL